MNNIHYIYTYILRKRPRKRVNRQVLQSIYINIYEAEYIVVCWKKERESRVARRREERKTMLTCVCYFFSFFFFVISPYNRLTSGERGGNSDSVLPSDSTAEDRPLWNFPPRWKECFVKDRLFPLLTFCKTRFLLASGNNWQTSIEVYKSIVTFQFWNILFLNMYVLLVSSVPFKLYDVNSTFRKSNSTGKFLRTS